MIEFTAPSIYTSGSQTVVRELLIVVREGISFLHKLYQNLNSTFLNDRPVISYVDVRQDLLYFNNIFINLNVSHI